MAPSTVKMSVFEHRKTHLLMAVSDEVPGFVVYAHTEEELEKKLAPAFEAFMHAVGETNTEYQVENQSTPGYWPPVLALRAARREAA
jgi:hypothetical protein